LRQVSWSTTGGKAVVSFAMINASWIRSHHEKPHLREYR
jgi:hypothetical protein